jgi:hypothetical protein
MRRGRLPFGTRNGDAPITNVDGTQDLAWTNFGSRQRQHATRSATSSVDSSS